MKKLISLSVISLLVLSVSCQKQKNLYSNSDGPTYLGVPTKDIDKQVNDLLKTWYPLLIDTINGGYWTNFSFDWKLGKDQDKMIVTQARGLWTASKAAQAFPDNPVFREAADYGYKFLTEKMWDIQNTGFYQYYFLGARPDFIPEYKTTYGNAFALYALTEYSKINQDPEVMTWVKKSFQWLEDVAHDSNLKGYFNTILPEGFDLNSYNFPLGNPELKDQNTSIHVLEALTNLYIVWPDNLVKERLTEMFDLVRDKMVNSQGFLNLFFTKDWTPVSHREESRSFILDNIFQDHVSFGHDIETAYLLIDGAKALFKEADPLTLDIAKKLVDHTLANGFDTNYYGLFDKGYYFKGSDEIEIVGKDKVWWSQAEALHSLALMIQYYPDEEIYTTAFKTMWVYINEQMIDPVNGGWYNNGLDSDPGNYDNPKGHKWKGCYHNGRSLMSIYQYAHNKNK